MADLEIPEKQADDRRRQAHDQGDLEDPVDGKEERLQARAFSLQAHEDQEDPEREEACEDGLADAADAEETVRSLESIVVTRHGRLGLWHDGCESPSREEDGQVLRNVVYSRSQIKHIAPNLHTDFIPEIHAHGFVRPRSWHRVAKRSEVINLVAGHRNDLESRFAMQRRGHADEAFDVGGHRFIRLPTLPHGDLLADVGERLVLIRRERDLLQSNCAANPGIAVFVIQPLNLTVPHSVDRSNDMRLRDPSLKEVLVEGDRSFFLDSREGGEEFNGGLWSQLLESLRDVD